MALVKDRQKELINFVIILNRPPLRTRCNYLLMYFWIDCFMLLLKTLNNIEAFH